MDSWLVILTSAVVVVILTLVLRGWSRRQARPRESSRVEAGEPGAAARDELARSAGVASFGINLPWRRSRSDPTRYRPR